MIVYLQEETFRFAECKKPFPVTKMIKLGVPAAEDEKLQVIARKLRWDEFQVPSCLPNQSQTMDLSTILWESFMHPTLDLNALKIELFDERPSSRV